jgi:hypothetical protein
MSQTIYKGEIDKKVNQYRMKEAIPNFNINLILVVFSLPINQSINV